MSKKKKTATPPELKRQPISHRLSVELGDHKRGKGGKRKLRVEGKAYEIADSEITSPVTVIYDPGTDNFIRDLRADGALTDDETARGYKTKLLKPDFIEKGRVKVVEVEERDTKVRLPLPAKWGLQLFEEVLFSATKRGAFRFILAFCLIGMLLEYYQLDLIFRREGLSLNRVDSMWGGLFLGLVIGAVITTKALWDVRYGRKGIFRCLDSSLKTWCRLGLHHGYTTNSSIASPEAQLAFWKKENFTLEHGLALERALARREQTHLETIKNLETMLERADARASREAQDDWSLSSDPSASEFGNGHEPGNTNLNLLVAAVVSITIMIVVVALSVMNGDSGGA